MKIIKIFTLMSVIIMFLQCSYEPCSIKQHAPDTRKLPQDMTAVIDIPDGGHMCIITDSEQKTYTRSFEYPNDSAKEISKKWLNMLKQKGWQVIRSDSDEFTHEIRVQRNSSKLSVTVSKVAKYNWTTIRFQK